MTSGVIKPCIDYSSQGSSISDLSICHLNPCACISAAEPSLMAFLCLQLIGYTLTGQPLAVAALCPMHGPVVQTSVTELLRQYQ